MLANLIFRLMHGTQGLQVKTDSHDYGGWEITQSAMCKLENQENW